MKKILIISLVCLFICQFAYAIPSKTFYSDGTIQDSDTWWGVSIYDTPPNHTTVDMTGGNIVDAGIKVCNVATLNMSDGNVWGGGLNALDQSTVNISGGYANGAFVTDNATVSISGNANVRGVYSYGTLNVYGGTIGQLGSDGSAVTNIYGGTIGGIDGLAASGLSVFNLMGGSVTYLMSGSSATINVFGYDLAKTNVGGIYGNGQVTGFWQDSSPFAIDLYGTYAYSRINLIPEPASAAIIALGSLFIGLRQKRF